MKNTSKAIEYIFLWNHRKGYFDSDIVSGEYSTFLTFWLRAKLNSVNKMKLYSCRLTVEEAETLNEKLRYGGLTVFNQLVQRSIMRSGTDQDQEFWSRVIFERRN